MAEFHKDLPDSELHEAKGFTSAANDRVLKKTGGASVWAQVDTNDIATNAVNNSKLAGNSVDTGEIVANAVTKEKMDNDSVGYNELDWGFYQTSYNLAPGASIYINTGLNDNQIIPFSIVTADALTGVGPGDIRSQLTVVTNSGTNFSIYLENLSASTLTGTVVLYYVEV